MRILQLTDKTASNGGIGAFVDMLTAGMRRRGHQVNCVRLLKKGTPDLSAALSDEYRMAPSYHALVALPQIRHWHKLLAQLRPDVIHLHAGFTAINPLLLAFLRSSYPIVGTLHDVRPFCLRGTRRFQDSGQFCELAVGSGCFSSGCVARDDKYGRVGNLLRLLNEAWLRKQWRMLPMLMLPSQYLRSLCLLHGFDESRLLVVPPAAKLAGARQCNEGGGPDELLCIGSLLPYKGAEHFIEMLSKLHKHDWRAHIVGDGPLSSHLQSRVESLGLAQKIQFHGRLNAVERDALLARARLLVFPSLLPESFGMVGIEAMAQGLPVVGYAAGGAGEWLRDGENGLVVNCGDIDGLAEAVARLLNDHALAFSLGQGGRDMVAAEFSEHHCLSSVESIYENALGGRSVA